MRDYRGIDRIGLGTPAQRLRKSPHLRRIDHHHWQAGSGKTRRNHCLEASGGLDRNQLDREGFQPFDQLLDPAACAADNKTFPAGADRNVQRSFDTSMPTYIASI